MNNEAKLEVLEELKKLLTDESIIKRLLAKKATKEHEAGETKAEEETEEVEE